jgi:RNA polymerase sigma-70 factor (ECF subfamily)
MVEGRNTVTLEDLLIHREGVFRICLGFARDYAEAEDLAQEVYLKAHRGLAALKNPATARDWLFRIARNTCLDHARTSRLRRMLLFRFVRPAAATLPDGDDAPAGDPRLALLKSAVLSLPPKLREAFVLREYAHFSYEDIGRTLGLRPGTVMSRLNRARASVAQKLQESRHEEH